MKRILLFIAMLASLGCYAQAPIDRTRESRILIDRATQSRFAQVIPGGSTPNIPGYVPDSLKTKLLFMKTTGSDAGLKRWNGSAWVEAVGVPDLSAYALDANVAHNAGTETISGIKTWNNNQFYYGDINVGAYLKFVNGGYQNKFLAVDGAGITVPANYTPADDAVVLHKADSTIYQTVDNFFPKADTRYLKATAGSQTINGSVAVTNGLSVANGATIGDALIVGNYLNVANGGSFGSFVSVGSGGISTTGGLTAGAASSLTDQLSISGSNASIALKDRGTPSRIWYNYADAGVYHFANSMFGDVHTVDYTTGATTFNAPVYLHADAVSAMEPITKNQFDNYITGVTWKQEVRVKTTGNITLSGTQTVDGVSLAVNDRVLVASQTDQTQNGIYQVKSTAWLRTVDADASTEISTAAVLIRLGTTNKNTQWTCTNATDPVIGTDVITFGQLSGAGTYTNGPSMSLSANVFDVNYSALDGHYVQLGGSYANPAWITSLAYNKITGVPTNVSQFSNDAGYLINGLTNITSGGFTSTATDGTGGVLIPSQTTRPATPSAGLMRLYYSSTGLTWLTPNGYTRSFLGTGLTADRVYTLPDGTGTLLYDGGSYINPSWIASLAQSKITYTGSASQYVRGDGSFSTFGTDLNTLGDARYARLGTVNTFSLNSSALPTAPTAAVARFANVDGTGTVLSLESFGASTSTLFLSRTAGGTAASPSGKLATEPLITLSHSGYGTSAYSANYKALYTTATENWTNTANGYQTAFYTIANGTATEQLVLTLAQDRSATLSNNLFVGNNTSITGRLLIGSSGTPGSLLQLNPSGTYVTNNAYSASGFAMQVAPITFQSTATTGTPSTVSVNSFGIPTLTATNSQAINVAATFYISGAPVAGTNVTIANPYAFYINSGNFFVQGNSTSSQYKLTSINSAPATATSTGVAGEIRFTTSGVYICTATNTWIKATAATF